MSAQTTKQVPSLDSALVKEFVAQAHGNVDRVRQLLEEQPKLANAAHDWGGGDWETGLGAAAHMGRRDIAEILLHQNARMDIFAAAMLGHLDVVRAMCEAHPDTVNTLGPHGIPLIAHARAGGSQAQTVVKYLEVDWPASGSS